MTAVVKQARDDRGRDAELGLVRERVLAGMRRIKKEFGLSYGRLAEKTHYSRSSWERFLNGKQWPSRAAIQQLADVVGQDPAELIGLWERAEELARECRRSDGFASGDAPGQRETERHREAERPGAVTRGGVEHVEGVEAGKGPGLRGAVGTRGAEHLGGGETPEGAAPRDGAATPEGAAPPDGAETREGVDTRDGADSRGVSRPRGMRAPRSAGRAKPLIHMAIGAVLGALIAVAVPAVNTAAGGLRGEAGRAAPSEQAPDAAAQGAAERDPATASDHPAPGCSGESCLGREPQTMNCQWDAKTVRLLYLRGLRIQLRHSPACKAVWGRLENGAIGDGVVITDKGSRTEEATIRVDRDTYTRMLSVAEYPLSTISICGVIPKVKERECDPVQADPQP